MAGNRATSRVISAVVQRRGGKAAERYRTADWSGLPTTKSHVMDGEVKDKVPKGLHAYTSESLPGGVTELGHTGNKNSVHLIWWSKGEATKAKKAKFSTMFPKQLTEGMVAALLRAAEQKTGGYPKTIEGNKLGMPIGNITIDKSGETMFPYRGVAADMKEAIVDGYSVENHLTS